MALTKAQIAEIKRRALAKGISEKEVDLAMPQLVRDFDAKMNGGAIDTTGVSVQKQPVNQNTTQPTPQTDENGNILTNFVKGIVQPAVDYGKFVGESVGQAVRVGVDKDLSVANPFAKNQTFKVDEIDSQIGQLTRQNREILAQMKSEKDKDKKKELATQSKAISAQINELGDKARGIGDKKTTYLMDEEKIKDRGSIALTGAKATAGAASYAIPGSIGVGGSAVGTVARAAGAGMIAGGLQGFGSSEDGQELNDTITGAAVGGVTAGAISGVGQVIKAVKNSRVQSEIGKKLSQTGTDFKKSAYVKAAGRKPIMREGGDKLIDKMMKAGIKPGTPDELIYQADDILIDNAGVIFDKADEFAQKGVTVDKSKLLDPLEQKLANAPAKSKPVIEKVIGFVKDDIDRFDQLTPAELYAMKGDYGAFGNWTSQMDADAVTEAKLWEEVYTNLNGLMDDLFKKGGYDDFRNVNEVVSTAINTKKYASRAGNVAPNLNTLGLMDAIAGGVGFSTTGVPGMIAGFASKRVLNSPQFSSGVGNTLEKVGTNLATKSSTQQSAGNTVIGEIMNRLTQRGLVEVSTGSGESVENLNNQPNYKNASNSLNYSNEQNAPLSDNNTPIIPQQPTFVHPDPRFRRYQSKEEMVMDAFNQGYDAKTIAILKNDWDENAPTKEGYVSSEVQSLLEQRAMLSKAGVSTKNIDSKLAEYGFEPDTTGNLSSSTENRVQLATSGLRALDEIEQLLAEDPTKMLKNVIPGKLGARDYDSAAFRAVEGLLRARSGAAIPESEVRRYMNANLPKIGDSKEEMKFKLEAFRKDLEDIALSSGSFDAATVLGM